MFRIIIEQDERAGIAQPLVIGGQPTQVIRQPVTGPMGTAAGAMTTSPSQALNAGAPPSFLRRQVLVQAAGRRAPRGGVAAKPPVVTAAKLNIGPAPEWLRKKVAVMTPASRSGKIPVA